MDCGQNSFMLVWQYHQHLTVFLVKDQFLRVYSQILLSDDKSEYEVKPGVLHVSPRIYLTAEEIPGRSHLGDRVNPVQPVIAWNGAPQFQMTYVRSHSMSWGRKKERMERENNIHICYIVKECINYKRIKKINPIDKIGQNILTEWTESRSHHIFPIKS